MRPPRKVWLVTVDGSFLVFPTRKAALAYIELVGTDHAKYHLFGPYKLKKVYPRAKAD